VVECYQTMVMEGMIAQAKNDKCECHLSFYVVIGATIKSKHVWDFIMLDCLF